jgi:glycerol-3-phosphate O-acyltransferase
LTSWRYKKPSAKTKTIEMTTTTATQQNAAAATAAAAAAAARDSLKTAELHHRFAQDIRRQIETEYNAAVDEEIAACGDMERKRRHADEMEESHKRARSDAFRSLVKATGGQTCVPFFISRCAPDDMEDGEISFTPDCTPPSSPRAAVAE